jgi:hypothetical protein
VKDNRDEGTDFEQRLLDELKNIVAQRSAEEAASTDAGLQTPAWRRPPRLAAGAGAALAIAAGVLVIGSGSGNTSQAFAVEAQEGGGVTIAVYSPEDAAGLEGALAEAGIHSQVTWLPAGMTCREPRFKQSQVKTPMGGTIGGLSGGGPAPAMTIGVITAQRLELAELAEAQRRGSGPNIALDPASFRPDQTVVISGAPGPYYGDPEGGYEFRFAIAEGPVESCEPIPVPRGGSLEETNRILKAEANER